MNSIILCEGSTDYSLLQYYMREAYQWIDNQNIQRQILKVPGQKSRNLEKKSDILTIMSVGGCSRFPEGLNLVLKKNYFSSPDLFQVYNKIVLVTDRDEVTTEHDFIETVEKKLNEYNVVIQSQNLVNNCWVNCTMENQIGISISFAILLMIIPFEKDGAMETFLLNAIQQDEPYDKTIIDECNRFVDSVDPEKRYLSSRRYVTKAKFDTYFSIRTPVEQFVERQNILKGVKWENYTKIQTDFEKLGEL